MHLLGHFHSVACQAEIYLPPLSRSRLSTEAAAFGAAAEGKLGECGSLVPAVSTWHMGLGALWCHKPLVHLLEWKLLHITPFITLDRQAQLKCRAQ